jgi:acetyl-CoA acetyltransferase
MSKQSFSNRCAIVGIGYTEFSRNSGMSVHELAMTAVMNALADAGVDKESVDGLLSYHLGDSVSVVTVARTMGLQRIRWHNDIYGGGTQCASILGDAAMVIDAGLAETVVIYRALNGRSGKRMGQQSAGAGDGNEAQFVTPYGCLGPVNTFALAAQRFLFQRGLHEVALASVVLSQRECAKQNPVYIRNVVRGGGLGAGQMDKAIELDRIFSRYIAPELYRVSGVSGRSIVRGLCAWLQ